ncbi:hypothetical protein [Streptomyces rubellomurinus]|uniref:hypothetical protein n=1 Tax=Streptomyces rubellomurinus (strain ATCC 31215) TaxID=359131 RepID=UPI0012FEDD28|nr:hypothetical protein [Streptomyces rubellomurinus]
MPSNAPRSPVRVLVVIHFASPGEGFAGVLETRRRCAETWEWVVAAVFIDARVLPPFC